MHSLRSRLPPPNWLVTFEASGRHLSFTKAAEELCVTRVAVSQQIKALEEFLHTPLFHRLHRALRLTRFGHRYHAVVTAGLQSILLATQDLQRAERANSVTVTTTTGFSTYWLMPRIGEFRKRHPGIDLRFMITDSCLDLVLEDIDVAIRYGTGNWPDLRAMFLLQEHIFPVCSKDYFAGRKRLREPHELLDETLLHLEGRYDSETRWLTFFRGHGIEIEDAPQGIRVNTYTNLVQATLEGQGISLIGPPLVQRYLETGELVRPLQITPTRRRAFHMVFPVHQDLTPAAARFCEWVEETAGSEGDYCKTLPPAM